jgi:hypothetical protein
MLRILACLLVLGAGTARAEESSESSSSSSESQSSENAGGAEESQVRTGELASVGVTQLQTRGNRFGLRVGAAKIGQGLYIAGSLELDLTIKKLSFGLGTPVNIPVYDPAKGAKLFPNGMSLRSQDYATWRNFIRVIRYVTLGKKEGDYYLDFSQQYATTIGHGGAVRRYLSNLDVNQAKLSGEFDMKFKYGGFETYVGDVLRPDQMMAGLVYLKPLGAMDNVALKSLSLGATYAGDFSAPLTLKKVSGYPVLDSSGSPRPVVDETRQVHIVGFSVETKVVKNKNADIKPYVYGNQMMVAGGGASEKLGRGLAIGGLGRFGYGQGGRHAFRTVLEGRVFEANFMPGYFDTFYDIQRYQYFGPEDSPSAAPTKLADLMSRGTAMKVGYYVEAQYAWARHFAFTAAWEDSNAKGGRNLLLHMEVPTFPYLRFFGSVYYRGIASTPEIKAPKPDMTASNVLYFAGARVKLLPILFVNLRAFHTWQIEQADPNNSYRNVNGFQADIELGYEFSRK